MGLMYIPNETNTLWLQVLRISGSVPSFPADYNTPQVRIIHLNSGILIEDVAFIDMTQRDDNIWSYDFSISTSPDFGDYLAEFKVTIDGILVESSEKFKVQPAPALQSQGSGSCEITGDVKEDAAPNDPIPGTEVAVFLPSDLTSVIALDFTDNNGEWTLFLDPGLYKVRFTKPGKIPETHDMTVNANCTFSLSGD